MDFTGIPIIIVFCYMIGEVYKMIFKKKKYHNYIPTIMLIVGGILGIVIYLTEPHLIKNCDSIWTALMMGIISGACSTGANQIIKQISLKNKIVSLNENEKEVNSDCDQVVIEVHNESEEKRRSN